MQLEERRYAIAVGSVDELEGLALEHRRGAIVGCQPSIGIDNVLDAHQPPLISQRLIDERFRMLGIDLSINYQRAIDVVNAHGAVVRTADAAEIDPGPGSSMTEIATYYQLRDYKGLIESREREVISNPNEWTGYQNLAIGYEGSGKLPEAIAAFQKAVEISNGNQDVIAGLAHAYAAMGKTAETRNLLNNLQRQSASIYMSPYLIATIYAALGDKDKAFESWTRPTRSAP